MSTKLTSKGVSMVESKTLQLALNAGIVTEMITSYLSKQLIGKGYESASPAVLNFLSTLECGVNYASEIARNLGVSRQMVAKTVKEFCRIGYLEQVAGVGKQKEILFTEKGEHLMSDARMILAEIDSIFLKKLEKDTLKKTVAGLAEIHAMIVELSSE